MHLSFDAIECDNEADFDPKVLYSQSKKVNEKNYRTEKPLLSSAAEPRTKYGKK